MISELIDLPQNIKCGTMVRVIQYLRIDRECKVSVDEEVEVGSGRHTFLYY